MVEQKYQQLLRTTVEKLLEVKAWVNATDAAQNLGYNVLLQ